MTANLDRVANPERLAYWYFRLNGFLTTENFVVHPVTGTEQRTDADLLAVRLLYRAELPSDPMPDDPKVSECATAINVIIAEIKFGQCSLNGPWTNRKAGNVSDVLSAIGCVPQAEREGASRALYESGRWSDGHSTVRLFAIGETTNADLPIEADQQITWGEIIRFCCDRIQRYERAKSAVGQWAPDGLRLKDCCLHATPELACRFSFGLRARPNSEGAP